MPLYSTADYLPHREESRTLPVPELNRGIRMTPARLRFVILIDVVFVDLIDVKSRRCVNRFLRVSKIAQQFLRVRFQ